MYTTTHETCKTINFEMGYFSIIEAPYRFLGHEHQSVHLYLLRSVAMTDIRKSCYGFYSSFNETACGT